jgi:hypothetical protein
VRDALRQRDGLARLGALGRPVVGAGEAREGWTTLVGCRGGEGRDLHDVEVPEQPDPHDAGQDVQPAREAEFVPREEARIRSFTATRGPRVITHKGEADQALLQWTWPTTDDSDLAETLRLGLLARVARIALTEKLREELGQAYSPSAGASNSRHRTLRIGSGLTQQRGGLSWPG